MTILHRALLIMGLAAQAVLVPEIAAKDQSGYGPDQFEFDPSLVEQWKEVEVRLPPAPKDANLLEVPLPPGETLKLFIDQPSLTRDADRVVRYTAVLQSQGGVRNTLFEGIRCETREYKTYAIGDGQGTLQPQRDPGWRPIPDYGHNAFRRHLSKFFFCDPMTSSARTPREVVQLIKYPPVSWGDFLNP